MTSEHETARLSDYLDGELTAPEAAAVEAHLSECDECAATAAELRAVVSAAHALPDLPPERDLWPEIEARLTPRGAGAPEEADADVIPMRRHRRVTMTVPQLAAAAIALVLFSASAVWLTLEGIGIPASQGSPVAAVAPAGATTVAFTDFDEAMVELEADYQARRGELDAETIRVVERNLAIIDQAILEARDALDADPGSGFLSSHLANAMRQKMDLLRQAAQIAQSET